VSTLAVKQYVSTSALPMAPYKFDYDMIWYKVCRMGCCDVYSSATWFWWLPRSAETFQLNHHLYGTCLSIICCSMFVNVNCDVLHLQQAEECFWVRLGQLTHSWLNIVDSLFQLRKATVVSLSVMMTVCFDI